MQSSSRSQLSNVSGAIHASKIASPRSRRSLSRAAIHAAGQSVPAALPLISTISHFIRFLSGDIAGEPLFRRRFSGVHLLPSKKVPPKLFVACRSPSVSAPILQPPLDANRGLLKPFAISAQSFL